jgi:nucleotide-binding universal stress UspA family protein
VGRMRVAVDLAQDPWSGVTHLWLGSVAEKLVRIAPVPVLVLRIDRG